MKIEVWFDFYDEQSHLQIEAIDQLIKDYVIKDLDLLYRSYPMKDKVMDTTDFHRLSHLAKKYHTQHEFNLDLCREIKHHHMINSDLLLKVAKKNYLDTTTVQSVLSSDAYLENVESNYENALLKKIHKVPHIRIEGTIKLDGYQSKDALIRSLNLAKANLKTNEHCVGEHCGRKKTH